MDKDEQSHKMFLEEQVDWCKKQDRILAEIERNLYEMKGIAEYAASNDFSPDEIVRLNDQLNSLKKEIQFLEMQLHDTFH